MEEVKFAFAKLAGVLKAVRLLLEQTHVLKGRSISNFSPDDVAPYFQSVDSQLTVLRNNLSGLYSDFPIFSTEPNVEVSPGSSHSHRYDRRQLEGIVRTIEQVFELRANSELAVPTNSTNLKKVFISHGRSNDWKDVQSFVEKDLEINTMELAQEPNRGRTILQKLNEEAINCDFAVIVMTGDDFDSDGTPKARENVMHEVGYFQGKYGLSSVCLLHEEGTNIPSNIHGMVYIPFPKGYINATFGTLMRELKAFYK